jgi:hypothetical protein
MVMIARLVKGVRVRRQMIRRESLLRSLDFGAGEQEFFLVSFPKAGNTWLRLMIANLLGYGDQIGFHNLGKYVPDSESKSQVDSVIDRKSRFYNFPVQIIKSHDYFLPFYRRAKVIYVVRNGIDCITSYYHYLNARANAPIPREAFIDGDGIKVKSWRRHLLSWYDAPVQSLLIVKYEDLNEEPGDQLHRVVQFLGIDADGNRVKEVVAKTNFAQMQQMEERFGYYNAPPIRGGRQAKFVRRGQVAAKTDVYTDNQIERFTRLSADAAKLYGYK